MIEEALITIIKGIVEKKRSQKLFPDYALKKEVFAEINNALNALYKQGRIDAGETVNDKWISLKNGKEGRN